MFAIPSRRATAHGDAGLRPEASAAIQGFFAALARCEAYLARSVRRRGRRRGESGLRRNAA